MEKELEKQDFITNYSVQLFWSIHNDNFTNRWMMLIISDNILVAYEIE